MKIYQNTIKNGKKNIKLYSTSGYSKDEEGNETVAYLDCKVVDNSVKDNLEGQMMFKSKDGKFYDVFFSAFYSTKEDRNKVQMVLLPHKQKD